MSAKKILLEYFREAENDAQEPQYQNLGKANKNLANLFIGLKEDKNFLIGVYNDEEILDGEQIKTLNLFETSDKELDAVDAITAQIFTELQEEADFVAFIRKIISAPPDKKELVNPEKNICRVNLKKIWENLSGFKDKPFPQFKRMIYIQDGTLPDELRKLFPAYIATINFKNNFRSIFKSILDKFSLTVENIFTEKAPNKKNSTSIDELSKSLIGVQGLNGYKAKNICEVFIASMSSYPDKVFNRHSSNPETFSFTYNHRAYFRRVKEKFEEIVGGTKNGTFYIIGNKKDFESVLGTIETMGILTFDITGGLNNQLCIHINQIRVMENILNNKKQYSNKILNKIEYQYRISRKMLEYIYEGDFDSAEVWELLEDYFLGIIPIAVHQATIGNNFNAGNFSS